MKKKIGIIISLVVVIALAVDITAAVYLFNTTIVREHASAGRAQSFTGVDWEIYGDIRDEMQRSVRLVVRLNDVFSLTTVVLNIYAPAEKSAAKAPRPVYPKNFKNFIIRLFERDLAAPIPLLYLSILFLYILE